MPFPELKVISDVALNDTDKILFTVPDGEVYDLLTLYCILSTTNVVGSRRLQVQIQDPSGTVIFSVHAKRTQAASITSYKYSFFPGAGGTNDASYIEDSPLPQPTLIPSGYKLRVYDENGIDAAADDMLLHAQVKRHQPGVD